MEAKGATELVDYVVMGPDMRNQLWSSVQEGIILVSQNKLFLLKVDCDRVRLPKPLGLIAESWCCF